MLRKLRAVFLSGLLAILPLGLTIYVLLLIYQLVAGWLGSGGFLGELIRQLAGRGIPDPLIDVLSLFILLLIILLVGALTQITVGRLLYHTFERLILAIPVLRKLYATFKQLIDATLNRDVSAFKRVVLVEYPSKGLYMLGFVTNDRVPGVEEVVGDRLISVFIMSPPNPVTGVWLIVPERDVIYLDHITVEEGFRMVMTLGISVPEGVAERLRRGETPPLRPRPQPQSQPQSQPQPQAPTGAGQGGR